MARTGKALETQLERMHQSYASARLAWVVKAHPGVRVTPSGDLKFTHRGPPDFFGVIAGGKPVCFEAKECERNRWQFSLLKDHQAITLGGMMAMGAHSFIVLRFSRRNHILRWGDIEEQWWAWRNGPKGTRPASVSATDPRLIQLRGAAWLEAL